MHLIRMTSTSLLLLIGILWISVSILSALPEGYIYCWSCTYNRTHDHPPDYYSKYQNACIYNPVIALPYPNVVECNLDAHYSCYSRSVRDLDDTMLFFERGCKPNHTNTCMTSEMTSCTNHCEDGDTCNNATTMIPETTTQKANILPDLTTQPENTLPDLTTQPDLSLNQDCYDCMYSYGIIPDPPNDPCINATLNVVSSNDSVCKNTALNECYITQQNFSADGYGTFNKRCKLASDSPKICLSLPDIKTCTHFCETELCNDRRIPPDATPPPPEEVWVECYSCSYEWSAVGYQDLSCLYDPASVVPPNMTCNITAGDACYTHRVDMDSGVVKTFYRGCAPANVSECYQEDYKVCNAYCTTDYCNYNNGCLTSSSMWTTALLIMFLFVLNPLRT